MKTIFFDVDTQLDFVFPAGALYVPQAADLVKGFKILTAFAAANQIQVISTMDAHSENDPEFQVWKPHCVVGTTGQQKAGGTLLPGRIILTEDLKAARGAAQIIVEKQKLDCFTNPNLRPLLKGLNTDRCVLYGVVTELCVQCTAFGLLETGMRVELVSDAIRSLDAAEERAMIGRFEGEGGVLTTVAKVTV